MTFKSAFNTLLIMKKLSTLLLVFLMGIGMSYANTTEDDRYRGYSNSFIFNEGGIEFAVFPDGQFDFNHLNNAPQFSAMINNRNANISFNTGFNYDAFVQYDSYGAVIQIENTPVFYDGYGRIIQAGNVFINYNNGWVNRVGNLNVFYNRPGVILRTSGFINNYNRFYVYQPWHGYYGIPLVNNCIVWNNPYRLNYNPFRFGWNHHRNHWNNPNYYNGPFSRPNVRRNFYRPNDRVNYRSFERGRRDASGRAVATRNATRSRDAISTGRRTVTRNDSRVVNSGRSVADRTSSRNTENNVSNRAARTTNRAINTTSRSSRSNDTARTTNRSSRTATAISNRNSTRTTAPVLSNTRTTRTAAPAISNTRTSRVPNSSAVTNSRNSRTTTAAPRVSNSRTNSRATSTNSRSSNATGVRAATKRSTSRR